VRLSVDGVPMLSFVKNVIGRRAEADCHAVIPFTCRITRFTLPHIGWCGPP
jgi:hypothetical protein